MVESLAQLGAYMLLMDDRHKGLLPLFGGIDKARFRRQVLPDSKLDLKVELSNLSKRAGKSEGSIFVEGEKACEMNLMFVLVPAS